MSATDAQRQYIAGNVCSLIILNQNWQRMNGAIERYVSQIGNANTTDETSCIDSIVKAMAGSLYAVTPTASDIIGVKNAAQFFYRTYYKNNSNVPFY